MFQVVMVQQVIMTSADLAAKRVAVVIILTAMKPTGCYGGHTGLENIQLFSEHAAEEALFCCFMTMTAGERQERERRWQAAKVITTDKYSGT